MRIAVLAAVCLAVPLASAGAEDIDGAAEFAARCAVCHGDDGRGHGPYEMFLKIAPTDLTRLSAENRGEFPYRAVYKAIDGRAELLAHGPREMPIWGYEYARLALRDGEHAGDETPETVAAQKIRALVEHIRAMQAE